MTSQCALRERYAGWKVTHSHLSGMVIAYPLALTPVTYGRVVERAVLTDIGSAADLDKYRGRLRNAVVLATPPMLVGPRFVQDAFGHTEEALHVFETTGRDLLIQHT